MNSETPELIEDCLHHVFSFLKPHDMINVSRVCQFWKEVALRQWSKVTKIYGHNIYKIIERDKEEINVVVEVFKKIIICAAPFVKILDLVDVERQTNKLTNFTIGNYGYNIVEGNLTPDSILKLLVLAGATEVTKVRFGNLPAIELLKSFLKNNMVKSLEYENSSDCHRHIPTEGIEELALSFDRDFRGNLESFEGCFPNLKRLTIFGTPEPSNAPQILSAILPFVLGVTFFEVFWCPEVKYQTLDQFSDILQLSQLEELHFKVFFNERDEDNFFDQLRTCCPKLRVVNIDFSDFTERTLLTLLSLPNLECLKICLSFGFPIMEFPEMKNLSHLTIKFHCRNAFMTGFEAALKKMPKLKVIERLSCFEPRDNIKVLCETILIAALQKKEVIVTSNQKYFYSLLKIVRQGNTEAAQLGVEKCETLTIKNRVVDRWDFEQVKKYLLENNLRNYKISEYVYSYKNYSSELKFSEI